MTTDTEAQPIGFRGDIPVTILVVDDDQIDVRLTKRALLKSGVGNRVVVAKDGVDALGLLRSADTSGLDPAKTLVLVDLNMPRMNGIELLRELRRDPDFCRMVAFVISTSDAPRDLLAAYEQQVAGYLLKDAVDGGGNKGMALVREFLEVVRFPPAREELH